MLGLEGALHSRMSLPAKGKRYEKESEAALLPGLKIGHNAQWLD